MTSVLEAQKNKEARDTFFEENKKLVLGCINKYYPHVFSSPNKEDYIQCGYIGLLKAIEDYDGRGEFSTYAYHKIRGEVSRVYTHDQIDRPVRVSRQAIEKLSKYNTLVKWGFSEEEALAKVRARKDTIWAAKNALKSKSLDAPLGDGEENSYSFLREVVPSNEELTEDKFLKKESLQIVFNMLSPLEKDIVLKKFLFGYTYNKITESNNTYRSKVASILKRVTEKVAPRVTLFLNNEINFSKLITYASPDSKYGQYRQLQNSFKKKYKKGFSKIDFLEYFQRRGVEPDRYCILHAFRETSLMAANRKFLGKGGVNVANKKIQENSKARTLLNLEKVKLTQDLYAGIASVIGSVTDKKLTITVKIEEEEGK